MAEAIAIFGLISGSIGTINTTLQWIERFKKTVREFRNVGQTLHELWSDFIVLQIRFDEWSKLYKVNKSQATEDFAVIWGRNGAESITLQLVAIYRVIQRFNDILAIFMSTEVLDILNPRIQHEFRGLQAKPKPVSLRKRLSQSSDISKKIKRVMSTEEKLDFLFYGIDGLKSGLEEFRQRMYDLQEDAKTFDERISKRLLPPNDPVPLPGAEGEETPELLQLALDTKLASNALYSSCIAPNRGLVTSQSLTKYVKIEMELRNHSLLERINTGNRRALQFHLLMARPDIGESPFEILVEGPIGISEQAPKSPPESQQQIGFLEACEAVLNDGESRFCVIFNSQALWFRSSLPPDLIQVNQRLLIPLSEIFSASRLPSSPSFLLEDKVSLAYQIVECGLLLLGTSWLSHLRSRYVQRTRDSRLQYRFVLETPLASSPGDQGQMQSREQATRTVLGMQIFWIGIVLTEIAIGQPVLDARVEAGKLLLQTAGFVHALVPRWYGVAEVLEQVHRVATRRYRNAVAFCLRKRPGSLHWRPKRPVVEAGDDGGAFEGIAREYYAEVFQAIETLRREFVVEKEED